MLKTLFLTIITIKTSITLKMNLKQVELSSEITEDEISETLSSLALRRIYNRTSNINFTSCALTAKYILLSVGGIEKKEELPELNLTKNNTENLNNIKNLLNQNYIIHIEFNPNHHIIIFKKNNKDLYILQGFQDVYSIKDWMNDKEVMKPYMTINEFFNKLKLLIDESNTKEERDKMILDLFLPKIFSDDFNDISKILSWFLNYEVSIVNVNYVPFNFKQNQNSTDFKKLWKKVDSQLTLSDEI